MPVSGVYLAERQSVNAMITFSSEPLPAGAEDEFRKWLARTQVDTLRRVVAAKQKERECAALRDAVSAATYERKFESANENLRAAQRYEAFLDVLKEITEQHTPFTTAKLS